MRRAWTERCSAHFQDPEPLFYIARELSHLGESARALAQLQRVVACGYVCFRAASRDPWLEPLRSNPEFGRLLERMEQLEREMKH